MLKFIDVNALRTSFQPRNITTSVNYARNIQMLFSILLVLYNPINHMKSTNNFYTRPPKLLTKLVAAQKGTRVYVGEGPEPPSALTGCITLVRLTNRSIVDSLFVDYAKWICRPLRASCYLVTSLIIVTTSCSSTHLMIRDGKFYHGVYRSIRIYYVRLIFLI